MSEKYRNRDMYKKKKKKKDLSSQLFFIGYEKKKGFFIYLFIK